MTKPVSLAAHKNQRRRRRAKAVREDIRAAAGVAHEDFGTELTGYTLICWDGDGNALSFWRGCEPLKGCPLDRFAQSTLQRALIARDVRRIVSNPEDGA